MHKPIDERLPEQQQGVQSNTEAAVQLETVEAAQQFYSIVRQRLIDVNHWHDLTGTGTADFKLTDGEGQEVDRTVQKGDYFKIDIPGPGPVTGDGFDWVQVEAIEEDEACIVVRVRPASNPTNNRSDVAHFFSDTATSNFVVKLEGKVVTAAVHGRNEKPNTDAEKIVDKARNTAVATGAAGVFSKLQWKRLVNALVKQD